MDRILLTPAERQFIDKVITRGLRVKTVQWTVARIALARSLQMPTPIDPEKYARISKQPGGVELHQQQLTGDGKGHDDDFTEIYRAMISVYEGRNLFSADEDFHDCLQRHVRRGLDLLQQEWRENTDFSHYLREQIYFDRHGESGEVSIEEQTPKIRQGLSQIGVSAEVLETVDGPRLTRYTLALKELDDLDRLRRGLTKIAFSLGHGEEGITYAMAPGAQQVYLIVPRPSRTWRSVKWPQLKPALFEDMARAMALPICLGTDILGKPFLIDLAEAPHLFLGGTTGSGKSMCLHAILLSLLVCQSKPELVLVDPKAVEFSAYTGLRALREKAVVTTTEDAVAALNRLVEEMASRQEIFLTLDARNLTEANARGANLKRIVVVIDELGDLFLTSRDVEVPLIRLAQKARSAGIHLVLATQRPEAATFPGLLRSNIPSRIALTVQKAAESRIILDESGAEFLLMRGDMLVRFAGRPTCRAHGPLIESGDIAKGVKEA